MKHSISLSTFTYKPRFMGEGGFSLRMAYQLNYVFRIQTRSFTYKLCGFLPGTYGNNNFLLFLKIEDELGEKFKLLEANP